MTILNRMTPRIRAMLEAAGRLDSDGIGRRARPHRCRACHALTLHGLDCDRVGLAVTVDPTALSGKGELAARILGLKTYDIRAFADGRIEIDDRDQHRIRGRPADSDDVHVAVEHKCGLPPLPTKPETTPEESKNVDSDEPPF